MVTQVLFAGNLLLIAFVSYFGAKLHRPRIIALGCTVLSFGCLLISLPHFLFGRWVFCLTHSSFYDPSSHINPYILLLRVLFMGGDIAEHVILCSMITAVSLGLLLRWLQKSVTISWGESPLCWAPAFAFILLLPLAWALPSNRVVILSLLTLIFLDGQ